MSGSFPRKTIPTASLIQHVDHFQHRVLQDALADATAAYWNRRAEAFLDSRPRPGEFFDQRTPAELRCKWIELTEIAESCRARAKVSLLEDLEPEVAQVLREAA